MRTQSLRPPICGNSGYQPELADRTYSGSGQRFLAFAAFPRAASERALARESE